MLERDMMPALRVDDDLAVPRQIRKSQLLFPLLCRETFPVIRRDIGRSVRLFSADQHGKRRVAEGLWPRFPCRVHCLQLIGPEILTARRQLRVREGPQAYVLTPRGQPVAAPT